MKEWEWEDLISSKILYGSEVKKSYDTKKSIKIRRNNEQDPTEKLKRRQIER